MPGRGVVSLPCAGFDKKVAVTHANKAQTADLMLKHNPSLVLRNHLAEQAIALAQQKDFSMVQALHEALQRPFDEQPGHADWCNFPPCTVAT